MTTKDVRNMFDIELNAKSDGAYDTFVNEEKDAYISFGIRQFYARRLSGLTSDRTSFEQWQKRSDDLRCVYTKDTISAITTGVKNGNKYSEYNIPDNYWHMLSEDVDVIETTRNQNNEEVLTTLGSYDIMECTTDNLTSRLNNTLGDHIYDKKRIRPLRLYTFSMTDSNWYDQTMLDLDAADINGTNIFTIDGENILSLTNDSPMPRMRSVLYYKSPSNISLGSYTIEYIRKPNNFGVYSNEYRDGVLDEDLELAQIPDYAWDEVLSIAIKHALENSSSYRIQTYNSERAEIQ